MSEPKKSPTAGDVNKALSRDHVVLDETFAARRYFRKFDRIVDHLNDVAAEMRSERTLSKTDVKVIGGYVSALDRTFQALSMKYLMSGRDGGAKRAAMSFDALESGFPVFAELLTMANDAQQAEGHLRTTPGKNAIKADMIRKILGEQEIPTHLQYAMSQRLYYEALQQGGLFWSQNDPEPIWLGNSDEDRRRHYLLHWAVYDSQVNMPVVYLMDVEDTGRRALPKDLQRWPEVQSHLMAQSVGGLKLLTIAHGFDQDFDDLHPKRLRRIHLGPMYSSAYTRQTGPIRQVLEDAGAPEGEDWTLAWTLEELESEQVKEEKKGWFGTVEREVFALDPFSGRGVDTGATRVQRSVILPERPYQVLAELDPPGFKDVRKFVVDKAGRVISFR